MIALGCDHGGYALMQEVITYLEKENIAYQNFGTNSESSCDYAVYAKKVAHAIANKECGRETKGNRRIRGGCG